MVRLGRSPTPRRHLAPLQGRGPGPSKSHRSLDKEAPGPHAQERSCCATADPAKTHTDRPYGKIERSILSIAPGEAESRSPPSAIPWDA